MGDGVPELLDARVQGEAGESSPLASTGLAQGTVQLGDSPQLDRSECPEPLGEKSLRALGDERQDEADVEEEAVREAGSHGAGRAGQRLRPPGDTGRQGVPKAE